MYIGIRYQLIAVKLHVKRQGYHIQVGHILRK